MVVVFGYFYDENGKYTHMDALENRPIFKERIEYDEVPQSVLVPEKLCEVHAENPESKELCADCVLEHYEHSTIKVPRPVQDFVGLEPIVPENCTLEAPPDSVYGPVFENGKWVKTKEYTPPTEPTKPGERTLQEQINNIKKVLDEILIGGAM